MKSKQFDMLFSILLVVGILLMGYGMFSGANTSFSFDNLGFNFL